jgi:hypothetical protein
LGQQAGVETGSLSKIVERLTCRFFDEWLFVRQRASCKKINKSIINYVKFYIEKMGLSTILIPGKNV